MMRLPLPKRRTANHVARHTCYILCPVGLSLALVMVLCGLWLWTLLLDRRANALSPNIFSSLWIGTNTVLLLVVGGYHWLQRRPPKIAIQEEGFTVQSRGRPVFIPFGQVRLVAFPWLKSAKQKDVAVFAQGKLFIFKPKHPGYHEYLDRILAAAQAPKRLRVGGITPRAIKKIALLQRKRTISFCFAILLTILGAIGSRLLPHILAHTNAVWGWFIALGNEALLPAVVTILFQLYLQWSLRLERLLVEVLQSGSLAALPFLLQLMQKSDTLSNYLEWGLAILLFVPLLLFLAENAGSLGDTDSGDIGSSDYSLFPTAARAAVQVMTRSLSEQTETPALKASFFDDILGQIERILKKRKVDAQTKALLEELRGQIMRLKGARAEHIKGIKTIQAEKESAMKASF